MRFSLLMAVAAAGFCANAAIASPLFANESSLSAEAPLIGVHHKPGHHGGPPWMQRNQTRDEWREDRWDYGGYYGRDRPYTVCRTTYRTYFDPYTGEYVQRPVRVCG